ncbi:MAG: putative membrane protein [Gammaproteobacteria bacterium]|jgi:putative membrane protein
MIGSALIAFGHFVAFFGLTAALVLQIALLTDTPSIDVAKRIQRADKAYGVMALFLLAMGFLRVFYFDKGSDYYFSNTYFIVKLTLFVLAGLISAYPTITYLGWNKEIKLDQAPKIPTDSLMKLRKALHYQLIGIVGILFCASMMAKGIG